MGKYKYRLRDTLAIIACLSSLTLIMVLLPEFWIWWIKALIGLGFASILFIIYLYLRPSDELISLEEKLQSISHYATQINQISKHLKPEASSLALNLRLVATEMARTAADILNREFKYLSVEIQRLESLGINLALLCQTITELDQGGIYLRKSELYANIINIETMQLPNALTTIEEIRVAIHQSRAKQISSAEQELKHLHSLYKKNQATLDAIKQLQNILKETEE